MATVQLQNVSKRYGEVPAVRQFNLTTLDGEFIVLVGPSGCGKTTTRRMIAGLEAITEGFIRIDNRNVAGMVPRERKPRELYAGASRRNREASARCARGSAL